MTAQPDPWLAVGEPVDNSAAPAATGDPYAQIADPAQQTDQQPPANAAPDGSGFTDEQMQQIRDYLPKAKDAADLERFSLELSGGKAKIGNAQAVLDKLKNGAEPTSFAFTPPTIDKSMAQPAKFAEPLTMDHIRQAVRDALMNIVAPGLGTQLNQAAQTNGEKALIEHVANAAAADYGPEVGGLIDTILNGDSLDRNVAHERATLEGDSADHPIASIAGELGGMALTAPLAGAAADALDLGKAARAAGTVAESGLYGSGAAGPGNRAEGAAVGAGLGAATEAAIPVVKAAVGSSAGKAANAEFADAADRQNIGYMAADLPNASKSKFATALSSLTIGALPLAKQGEKNVASASAAADRVAGNIGTVADRTGAGQVAQSGAKQFMDATEAKMGSLYDAIPIPANAQASVSNTRAALSGLAQSFQSNPKLAAAFRNPQIGTYLDALTPQTTKEATGLVDAAGNPITRDVVYGGGLSWNDLKDFRTRVGKIIGQPGLLSDGQQMTELRALYGALSTDMQATATAFGPQAVNAFNRANTYARARADRIGNVVSMILGNGGDKAPQSAFEAMQRLANEKGGDPLKLARALRSMPEDEANTVRATMLDDLGSASPGQQNARGDAFSTAQFLTNWNKIGDRAKNVLFTGENRKAIDDLATVFSGMKSSNKFANTSKTGISVAAAADTSALLANPVLGALNVALQYGGGKLLASPAFARKLAATPKNIAGARAFWSRPWVQAMAVKNPAIAGEIQAFQRAFLNPANDNSATVSSAVASPDSEQQQQNQ